MVRDKNGAIYTDLTRKFQLNSMQGNKYMLFLYHHDSNTISIRPLKKRSDEETLKVYKEFYEFLQAQNCSPKLLILDNESSKALQQIFSKKI